MSLNWGKGLVQRPALFLLLVFQWSSWRRRPIPLLPLVASASSSTGGADLSLLRYRRRRCWFFLRRPSPRPPLLLLSPEFADGAPGKPSSRLHPSTFFFFFFGMIQSSTTAWPTRKRPPNQEGRCESCDFFCVPENGFRLRWSPNN